MNPYNPDVMKYKSIKLVVGEDQTKKMMKLQNSPLFEGVKSYSEFCCVVSMRRKKVCLDKPRFVGCAILAISKIGMLL